MAQSFARSVASGLTPNFSVPFPFLDRSHVKVSLDRVETLDFTWLSDGEIQLGSTPPAGTLVERRRQTPTDPIVAFTAGNLDTEDLNAADRQSLYLAQEADDDAQDALARAWYTSEFAEGGEITKGGAGQIATFDADGNIVPWSAPETPFEDRISVPVLATLDVQQATLLDTVEGFWTSGWKDPGDGGAAFFKKVGSEPSHPGKVRSANGLWFELTISLATPNFSMFGAVFGNTEAQNRDAIRAGLEWAGYVAQNANTHSEIKLLPGYWPWGGGTYDAVSEWRHVAAVPDRVRVVGPGTLVSSTPFATKSVGFLCRGDDIVFSGLNFLDTYTEASPFFVPIGAGTAYDRSGLEDGRTYRGLLVDKCLMENAWLSASVQFVAEDTGGARWADVSFVQCVSRAKANAGSAGNFNLRSDPPGKIINGTMAGCVAHDGKTASSFNFVGVFGFHAVGNTSFRNRYAALEIENGCRDGNINGLNSNDDVIGLWFDDSSSFSARGVIGRYTEEDPVVTPLLGTFYKNREVVKLTRQGYEAYPGAPTRDIHISGVVAENGFISASTFGSDPEGVFGRITLEGVDLRADGVSRAAGNRGFSINAPIPNLTLRDAQISGFAERCISLVLDADSQVTLDNVRTFKVGSEPSTGIVTSGSGRLVAQNFNPHSVAYNHTGGSEFSQYKINGVPQADRQWFAEITLADDTATVIPWPTEGNAANILVEVVGSSSRWGRARVVWSGAFATAVTAGANGSNFTVSGSLDALTGTDGIDGHVTVRATIAGLSIENRAGSSANIRVKLES